jgi:uncharacterized membrane protein
MPRVRAISDGVAGDAEPAVRRIDPTELRRVLAAGWEDFLAIPTQLVFLCVLYPLFAFILCRLAFGYEMLPLIYPLVAGFALIGPFAGTGLYELSRRRERGLPVSWLNTFDVLRSPALFSIVALGAVLLVIFVAWIATAKAIATATIGPEAQASFGALLRLAFTTDAGWKMIMLGNVVGFLFAAVALAISVVSFPLALDRNVSPLVAMRTSVRAVIANPVPMAAWGLIVAGALVIGCLPAFIGLAVVFPVLGHATWHLYRAVVV